MRYVSPLTGKTREMGLGSFEQVGLAEARAKAAEARALVFKGQDPVEAKQPTCGAKAMTATPTFGSAAETFFDAHQTRWRNKKVRNGWLPFMRRHCGKAFWDMPVSDIDHHHMLEVIQPLWLTKNCSAHRVMHRIGQVLDFSRVKGWRTSDTPRHKGTFEYVLPPRNNDNVRHHPALPFNAMPAFMERLRQLPGTAARAAEFAILTASRVGEVFGATYSELDLEAKVWRIPSCRYKTLREHVVPLSSAAIDVLARCPRLTDNPYVFPSPTKAGAPLSNMAIIVLLKKRFQTNATAHGIARSTFADWAADYTDFSFEVREGCLGHVVGNAVSRAYRRGDALEKRRALLEAWASALTAAPLRATA
jgi:integrase